MLPNYEENESDNSIDEEDLKKKDKIQFHFEMDELVDSEVDLNWIKNTQLPTYEEVCPPTFQESFFYPSVTINIQPDENFDLDFIFNEKEKEKKKLENQKKEKKNFDKPSASKSVHDRERGEEDIIDKTTVLLDEVVRFYESIYRLNTIFEDIKTQTFLVKTAEPEANPNGKDAIEQSKKPSASADDDTVIDINEEKSVNNASTNTQSTQKKNMKRDIKFEKYKKVNASINMILNHKIQELQNDTEFSIYELNTFKNDLCVEMMNTSEMLLKFNKVKLKKSN